jgi:hypothetical protein
MAVSFFLLLLSYSFLHCNTIENFDKILIVYILSNRIMQNTQTLWSEVGMSRNYKLNLRFFIFIFYLAKLIHLL